MQLTALSTTQWGAVSVQAASRRPAAAAPPRPAAAAAAVLQQRQRPSAGSGSSGRGRLVVTAAVKVQKGKQMLCSKTMKAKEGHEEQLRQLCQGVADFSRQRIADRSAGVLAFELSEDDYEKGTFHFMELYTSQAAMADHNRHPEFTQFVDKVQEHLEGSIGMVLYEYTNGKIGPAGMEGAVKGEGGLDDATGTNKFGGGASMKQTSAVVDLTQIKEKDDEEKGLWGLKGVTFKLPDWMGGRKQ
ncbi:antibiotic biosynthesis monooxygenase [Chlorella sorokiniana]|uniref:Antibiotic biosynthesis monooxygenase n=1 Tax=Chlorella sorokiniana TaxID=3076 RepID=A0A2P6TYZ5_CHLSO|nr:antibiotic biosynthesis monooxygenase [Chlorella sorokiniana]|eukprot:PRW59260.1 antibiotic biosynthesis monooxygenase [Chlorella sorokiniana]